MTTPNHHPSTVSVAVVAICGVSALRGCLDALGAQQGAPAFEIVVVYDPHLPEVPALAGAYPQIRLVANAGQRTPLELASRAIRESRGEIVLLTEDHCVPDPDWVASLLGAMAPGRAAVGGSVAVREASGGLPWAFYFVDFFRYAPPLRQGPSPSLTVCNVAYRRCDLEACDGLWQRIFHETAVNDALRRRGGALWLTPEARVTMHRQPRLGAALYERYAFGRLFGATRLEFVARSKGLVYTVAAPVLPLLLLGRMARKALPSRILRGPFLRSLVPLVLLVLAWSWGEWLGYLTRRRPRDLTVAPEAG